MGFERKITVEGVTIEIGQDERIHGPKNPSGFRKYPEQLVDIVAQQISTLFSLVDSQTRQLFQAQCPTISLYGLVPSSRGEGGAMQFDTQELRNTQNGALRDVSKIVGLRLPEKIPRAKIEEITAAAFHELVHAFSLGCATSDTIAFTELLAHGLTSHRYQENGHQTNATQSTAGLNLMANRHVKFNSPEQIQSLHAASDLEAMRLVQHISSVEIVQIMKLLSQHVEANQTAVGLEDARSMVEATCQQKDTLLAAPGFNEMQAGDNFYLHRYWTGSKESLFVFGWNMRDLAEFTNIKNKNGVSCVGLSHAFGGGNLTPVTSEVTPLPHMSAGLDFHSQSGQAFTFDSAVKFAKKERRLRKPDIDQIDRIVALVPDLPGVSLSKPLRRAKSNSTSSVSRRKRRSRR